MLKFKKGRESSLNRRKDPIRNEMFVLAEPEFEEPNNKTTSTNNPNDQIFSTTFKEDTKEVNFLVLIFN